MSTFTVNSSMVKMMKAVLIETTGGPEVLQIVDVPRPIAGPGEVLVRISAIGVGMPDMLVRRGVYAWMPKLPAVIGIESAGVIESIGDGVTEFQTGQKVYINARDLPERSGGYAAYRVAPANAVHALSSHVDLQQAATLGNYQVAESLLRMCSAFPAPRSVAIFGAAGGVGSAAIQLAKARGWLVIGIAGSIDKCAFALNQGAHHSVNYREHDVVDAICKLSSGGVDLILDIASGDSVPDLFAALNPFGIVVSYGFLEGEPTARTVPSMRKRFGHSPGWRLFSMHSFDRLKDLRRDISTTVIKALETGSIAPHIYKSFPLEEVQAAHRLFEQKIQMGKLVLIP